MTTPVAPPAPPPSTPAPPVAEPSTPESWDAYLQALPEAQRATVTTLYEAQTQGLRTALEKERDQRKTLEKDLRTAAKSETDGSDAQKRLTEMADAVEQANRRADFFRDAARPETGIADVEAAWIIVGAKADELIDKRGNVDFPRLRQQHPTLFKVAPAPRANAGNGVQQDAPKHNDVNANIRRAAGRA